MKLKKCSVCGNDVLKLWRSSPKTCIGCARSTFQPLSKTNKYISPISKNRQEALKRYRRLRDKHFIDNLFVSSPNVAVKRLLCITFAGGVAHSLQTSVSLKASAKNTITMLNKIQSLQSR